MTELLDYEYEFAIGEHPVTAEEWQQLVNSKSSLVQFRGQWIELDLNKMAQMLRFREQQETLSDPLTLPEIMHKLATEDDEFEVDPNDSLGQILAELNNQTQLQPVGNPEKLQGKLREYQKTGVAWLHYLEKIGLNGCLTDDMGLGKTLQVICSILVDQQNNPSDRLHKPTLLVVPTSVMGSWQKEVAEQLAAAEGIARQGLMLSTLMELKQICNHPAQFLQDGSAFTAGRSHKLQRLYEMVEEALAEGDSILIFYQFTEIGTQLQAFLREQQIPTYYIHGGVSAPKRQQMIEEFQNPEASPAVFILSTKARGTGITLTKTNHVFHFDRWWDRAFRIGQKKNIFVRKFITLGTLEERIDQMIEEKKKIADLVSGSDESWITKLGNEDFKQLIALNQQAVVE